MTGRFKCEYCGAEYGAPLDRARCEFECDEKQKQEAERAKRERLKTERDARVKEIQSIQDRLYKLCDQYEKDYGIQYAWDVRCYGGN